jgi:hypothetical protein
MQSGKKDVADSKLVPKVRIKSLGHHLSFRIWNGPG